MEDFEEKGAATPRVRREDLVLQVRESPSLNPQGMRMLVLGTLRLSHLREDRADLQEATKCQAHRMKHPSEYDVETLRRVALYPQTVPRAALRFPERRWPI